MEGERMWKDGRRTMICSKQLDTSCIVHVSTQHCVGGYRDEDSVYLWNKQTPLRRLAPSVLQLNSSSFPLCLFEGNKNCSACTICYLSSSRTYYPNIPYKKLCIMHYALRLLCCVCCPVQQSCSVQSSPFICVFLSQNPIREQIRHPFDSGLNFLFFARLRGWAAEEELGIFWVVFCGWREWM